MVAHRFPAGSFNFELFLKICTFLVAIYASGLELAMIDKNLLWDITKYFRLFVHPAVDRLIGASRVALLWQQSCALVTAKLSLNSNLFFRCIWNHQYDAHSAHRIHTPFYENFGITHEILQLRLVTISTPSIQHTFAPNSAQLLSNSADLN